MIIPELLGFEGVGERDGGEGEGTGDGLLDFSLEPQSSSHCLLCFFSSASILKHIHAHETRTSISPSDFCLNLTLSRHTFPSHFCIVPLPLQPFAKSPFFSCKRTKKRKKKKWLPTKSLSKTRHVQMKCTRQCSKATDGSWIIYTSIYYLINVKSCDYYEAFNISIV